MLRSGGVSERREVTGWGCTPNRESDCEKMMRNTQIFGSHALGTVKGTTYLCDFSALVQLKTKQKNRLNEHDLRVALSTADFQTLVNSKRHPQFSQQANWDRLLEFICCGMYRLIHILCLLFIRVHFKCFYWDWKFYCMDNEWWHVDPVVLWLVLHIKCFIDIETGRWPLVSWLV